MFKRIMENMYGKNPHYALSFLRSAIRKGDCFAGLDMTRTCIYLE